MKKKELLNKKIRNIVLMVLSQLLLTLFIGYWLQTQFKKEKKALRNNLSNIHWKVQGSIDNYYNYNYIISPFLTATDTINYSDVKFENLQLNEQARNYLIDSISVIIGQNQEKFENLKEFYAVDFIPMGNDTVYNAIYDVLNTIYGYRIINPALFEFRRNIAETIRSQIPHDDSLIKKYFLEQIDINNIRVNSLWIPDSVSLESTPELMCLSRYNEKTEKREVYVLFENYTFQLIKVLSPQIIFVFILFSLTGFALIFTYRGYVKQIGLNILRKDFINNITHELKIPVATAKAALEALNKYGLKSDEIIREEYIQMVNEEMNRLDRLTTRVLNHAKLEDNRLNLEFENTELNSFFEKIVNTSNLSYTDKMQVNYDIPDGKIGSNIDRIYFEGVIKNLIDNSLKYGGEKVIIDIKLQKDGQMAVITISDNGPGIPKEYLDKVFDKFFRVPNGNAHNVKGFGLGLSFAYLVMKQHNGSIEVANLKKGGCIFTLKLPLIT